MARKLYEIPRCMLNGEHIHCRPNLKQPIVVARVEDGPAGKLVVCPARLNNSGTCKMRLSLRDTDCLYPFSEIVGDKEEEKKSS